MDRDLVPLCSKSVIQLLVSLCLMVLATFEKQFSRPVYLSTANHCLSIQESINESKKMLAIKTVTQLSSERLGVTVMSSVMQVPSSCSAD